MIALAAGLKIMIFYSRIGMKPQLVLDEERKSKRFVKYKQFKATKNNTNLSKPESSEEESESDSLSESDEHSDEENISVEDSNKIFSDLSVHESSLDPETGLVKCNQVATKEEHEEEYNLGTDSTVFDDRITHQSVIKSVRVKHPSQDCSRRKSVIVKREDTDQTNDEENIQLEIEWETNYSLKICLDLMEVENLFKTEEKLYFQSLLSQFEGVFKISFGEEIMNGYIQFCKAKQSPAWKYKTYSIPMQFLESMGTSGKYENIRLK